MAYFVFFYGTILFCISMFQWPYNTFPHIWPYWWEDFWQFELFAGLSTIGMGVIVLAFIVWLCSLLSVKKGIRNSAYFLLFLGSVLFCYSMFQWHYNLYMYDALYVSVNFWQFVWISRFGVGVIVLSFIVWLSSFLLRNKRIKNVAFLLLFVGNILFSLSLFQWHYKIYYKTAPPSWVKDFAQFESFACVSKFGMALIVLSFTIWLYSLIQNIITARKMKKSI
jgi:hypothetical protein